jgi:hypothetical protein
MFRHSYNRPPVGSVSHRGSPAKLGFATTDHTLLNMEAHQKLGQSVGLWCCSSVQVTIWNADPLPGTVSLELILVHSEQRSRRQSLGVRPVTSSAGAVPVSETLEFAVPSTRVLEEFDEFIVVFHRDPKRAHRSARIEIDRFVLVPAVIP